MSLQQPTTTEITLQHTCTISAALPAKKQTFASLFPDVDSSTGAEQIQIPNNEAWLIVDLFIAAATDVPNADGDIYLTLEKNRGKKMVSLGPLSTMLQSNQNRPKLLQPYGFEAGSIMRVIGTNLNVPAAQRVNIFYMKVAKIIR